MGRVGWFNNERNDFASIHLSRYSFVMFHCYRDAIDLAILPPIVEHTFTAIVPYKSRWKFIIPAPECVNSLERGNCPKTFERQCRSLSRPLRLFPRVPLTNWIYHLYFWKHSSGTRLNRIWNYPISDEARLIIVTRGSIQEHTHTKRETHTHRNRVLITRSVWKIWYFRRRGTRRRTTIKGGTFHGGFRAACLLGKLYQGPNDLSSRVRAAPRRQIQEGN